MPDEYYSAVTIYESMTRGVIYQDNDDCVKQVINHRYWNAYAKTLKTNEHASLVVIYIVLVAAIIGVGLGGGFLAIRWLRRRAEEKGEEEPTSETLGSSA